MNFNNPYFTNKGKIDLLQRWVLVHSYIYYELNNSIVSDYKFDMNCEQLVKMMDEYPKEARSSKYYYVMHDFDGSSGFGLVQKLNKKNFSLIDNEARYVINLFGGN